MYTIVFLLLAVPLCMAQQKNNINDFRSATWNSNGPRWDVVMYILTSNNLDVLAIQEAGGINRIRNQVSDRLTFPLTIYLGGTGTTVSQRDNWTGLKEYVWNTGGNTCYLYYYDHRLQNPANGALQGVSKQNMAIVSKQRANDIIYFVPEVPGPDPNITTDAIANNRTFINRPIIGIRIANSVFFNVHPWPARTKNEAAILINKVANHMQQRLPSLTWMVMGDYNRTPNELQGNLPQAANGRFISIVNSGQYTRVSGELDYCVVGGPVLSQPSRPMVATLITLQRNPSDHTPVKFN